MREPAPLRLGALGHIGVGLRHQRSDGQAGVVEMRDGVEDRAAAQSALIKTGSSNWVLPPGSARASRRTSAAVPRAGQWVDRSARCKNVGEVPLASLAHIGQKKAAGSAILVMRSPLSAKRISGASPPLPARASRQLSVGHRPVFWRWSLHGRWKSGIETAECQCRRQLRDSRTRQVSSGQRATSVSGFRITR